MLLLLLQPPNTIEQSLGELVKNKTAVAKKGKPKAARVNKDKRNDMSYGSDSDDDDFEVQQGGGGGGGRASPRLASKGKQQQIAEKVKSAPENESDKWVQCSTCSKWRRVTDEYVEELGDDWFCDDNFWNTSEADCMVPEQYFEAEIESDIRIKALPEENHYEQEKAGEQFQNQAMGMGDENKNDEEEKQQNEQDEQVANIVADEETGGGVTDGANDDFVFGDESLSLMRA